MNTDIKNKIAKIFSDSGIEISELQLQQFYDFYNLLMEHNEEYDLTRIKGVNDIIIKHFIDSAYILKLTSLPSPLLDIGTGAGFPGIPLKIMNPELEIILAEPRKKRIEFMNMVIEKLELTKIQTHPHMVTDKSFFDINGVITRALELVDGTLARVNHFLPKNGKVIFMKGPGGDKDIEDLSESNKTEYKIELNKNYTLPGTDYQRKVLVFNKQKSTYKKTYRIMKDIKQTIGNPITSKDNKKYKELIKITGPDGIKKTGKVLVSGKKIIKELYNDKKINIHQLILFDEYSETDPEIISIIDELNNKNNIIILKKLLFNEIDLFNTKAPLLLIDNPEIIEWNEQINQGCSIMIPFQDPANVGSIIRSAVGMGVENIIILKEAANPFHPKSIRTSSGAVFQVNLLKGPSITEIENFPDDIKNKILILDKSGDDLKDYPFPEDFILLPGIEGPGIPENLKKSLPRITIELDRIESLNAVVATSIALYEWERKQK